MNTMPFGGLKVIESEWLTETGAPVTVQRSWRERLFSMPWRPLVKTRTFVPQVPMRGAVRLNATTIVMHPATVQELKRSLSRAPHREQP